METQSNEEKLEFWSLVVEEFENSGKSIREQCEANNIQLWQYYGWRKKVVSGCQARLERPFPPIF